MSLRLSDMAMVGFNFLSIITTFSSFLDEKTFTKLNLYVDYLCLWVAASLSTNRSSVCLSPRLSVAILTVRLFHQSTARLSVHPSVYPLLFFSTSLVVSTAGYPSIPPTVHLSVCLSVCLPVLSCFSANCQSPFRPQAVCLFTGCLSPFLTQTVRRGRVWLTQDEEGRQ